MTVGEANAKLSRIISNYDQYISGKNATDYEASMLYTQDNALQEFFTSKIKLGLETFVGNLRKIDTNPGNYNYKNTGDKKEELMKIVTNTSSEIFKYTDTIKEKSQEVFKEYVESFDSLNKNYEKFHSDALQYIDYAKTAQNNIDNNPYSATDESPEDVKEKYNNYSSTQARLRDNYLGRADDFMNYMDNYITSMKKILDKGLKKV